MERKFCGGLLLCPTAVLVLAGCGGSAAVNLPSGGSGPTLGNDAILLSPSGLKAESKLIGQPFYWAGTRKGHETEFQRLQNGYIYVRYLTKGDPAGAAGSFLTIGTYPFKGAFKGVKDTSNGGAVPGPGRSIVYVRPDPTSVLLAFHHVDYEIEVYSPRAKLSRKIAFSGLIRPVTKP